MRREPTPVAREASFSQGQESHRPRRQLHDVDLRREVERAFDDDDAEAGVAFGGQDHLGHLQRAVQSRGHRNGRVAASSANADAIAGRTSMAFVSCLIVLHVTIRAGPAASKS